MVLVDINTKNPEEIETTLLEWQVIRGKPGEIYWKDSVVKFETSFEVL